MIAGRILGLPVQTIPQVRIDAMKRPLDSLDAMREGRADARAAIEWKACSQGSGWCTARLANGRQARKTVTIADAGRETLLDLEFGRGLA